MKKIVFFGFFALSSIPFHARDLFVYKGTTKVSSVTNIKKITFGTGTMNAEQQDGTIVIIQLSDFNNFSLKEKTPTSVPTISANTDIVFDGTILEISNAQKIFVYDITGKELLCIEPQRRLFTLSFANYSSGIYIIKYIIEGKIGVQKIYKK